MMNLALQFRRSLLLLFMAAVLPFASAAVAADPPPPPRTPNGLALTPQMGWNSWNKFGCDIDEAKIRGIADAIVSSGMKDAGYQYVVIDDCWHAPARDADGNLQAHPERFPSGIKALADYVHSKGLKFGIYSDAGSKTCAGRPGSQGHEYQDAAQFARWGVDYLKYDWCSTFTRDPQEAYATMADALLATGRPILFSMCEWGNSKPWLWAANIGNSWRATGDIYDKWEGVKDYSIGAMNILDLVAPLYPFAGPGHWNDADMLEVGNGGMSDDEYRAHFALWAMIGSPLIAGHDVRSMDKATADILLNREIIAISQDPLGRAARRIWQKDGLEVWARDLADGRRAVALLNRSETEAMIGVDWTAIGYPAALTADVRDLWAHAEVARTAGRFETRVRPHAAAVLRIAPRTGR